MFSYFASLRFKQGEYFAASKIAPDIQQHVLPRFIIPPPKDYDPESERVPSLDEIAYLTGRRIGMHWPMRSAFLDPQYVADDLGDEGLERMFQIAQSSNPRLVPVATLDSLLNPARRTFLASQSPRLAIHLSYEDADPEALAAGLQSIACDAQDVVLFVDFTGADLDPELAAAPVGAIFDVLGEAAQWSRIVFLGSAFPTKNPADPNDNAEILRNEWHVFQAALKECHIPFERIGYGDYAADCGAIKFPRKSGGGRAIRHLRYSTRLHHRVERGPSFGSDAEAMKKVCQRIVASGDFAGREFSYADDRIWRIANGLATCGNASNWREWNTAHHLTRVVRDLGSMFDIEFTAHSVEPETEQRVLFEL